MKMNETSHYILNELKVIEKECREKGISATEWIERYAASYSRKYGNGSMQEVCMLKKREVR